MVAQNITFGIVAAMMAIAALRVVTTKNVVHAALHLVAVLAGAAVQFLLLAGEFIAITQVLVYIGAIIVLFLFGTMLTRARIGKAEGLTARSWPVSAAVALVLAGVLAYVLIDFFGDDELPENASAAANSAQISDSIFSTYLLPFWALGVLLTAALIGAIVLARRD